MRKKALIAENEKLRDANWDLVDAMRLTQEYITLPAVEGWSWYDALKKHAPGVLAELTRPRIVRTHDPSELAQSNDN